MIIKSKILETYLDALQRRVIKVLGIGKNAQTAQQANNFGIDSNPIKGMTAIYAETGRNGSTVIIGYINRDQVAAVGETRLFSLNSSGVLQTYVWLKNNGDILLGGDSKHLARYEELKAGFDQLKTDLNNLVSAFNTHVHATAAAGPPSIPTPATGIPATPSNASIDSSKTDKVKTS